MDVQNKEKKNGREILIAEDSPTQAERLRQILEQHDFRVSVAKNGNEALAAVDKRRPLVVISDIVMPEMDGYQLCRQIKANEKLKDVPVILLTSLADPVDVVKGLECGADNFITKPYDENYLLSRLQYILINRELHKSEKMQMGVEIFFAGRKYFITSERQQILNLLLSTYETAVQKNLELIKAQTELKNLNERLEEIVEERTRKLELEIAERKGAEEALQQNLARLTALLENLHVGVLFEDNVRRILHVNPKFCEIFGSDVEAPWLGANGAGLTEVAKRLFTDPEGFIGGIEERLADGIMVLGEQISLEDGRTLERDYIPISVGQQRGGHLWLYRDISERIRNQEALRKSESGLAEAQRIANLGNWEWDLQTRRSFWSDQMYRIFSLEQQESAPSYDSFKSWVHPEDRDRLDQIVQRSISEGKPFSLEHRILVPDKQSVRHIFAQGEVVIDGDGTPLRMAGTAQDITERKQAEEALRRSEEQLRQSQKMEAIGQLAGGIAHDFNNLLTAIIGYSDIVLNSLDAGNPLSADVHEIKRAGERAATLTSQLLAFSRKQVLQPKVLDLNEVVADMDKILRRLIGEDIELVTRPDPALGRVKADPGGIEQIVLNLAVNARDAMPEGGKLTIETANVDLDESYARGHIAVQPGPYVMLAVSDNGMGMSPETQAHIFEPFFTTKEKGKGTGLGLSTIYGIVKQSGGNIWVYSELGGGTTFKIYLPRVEEALTPVGARTPEAASRQGSETILLVEDAEVIRKMVSLILHEHGYTVLVAQNGSEALAISEQHHGPIHLMLTDVVMPQMTVRELTQRLAQMRPQTRILYVSGYTDDAIVHHGVLDEGTNFMQKPFTAAALLRKVREVLDKP